VAGPVDFFGNAQSSVTDIGAFQYSALYAADTRTLDPSAVTGAPYWDALGGGTPAIYLKSFGKGSHGKGTR